MTSFFVLLADGMHKAAAPDPSLVSTIFGLTTTFFGLVAFAVALRRGSGPYGRGSTGAEAELCRTGSQARLPKPRIAGSKPNRPLLH